MDSHNLATLFGPNILHKAKGGAFQVESQERAEERVEVIEVVKEMIYHQNDIFALPADIHDETLRLMTETNPRAVDQLLNSRTAVTTRVDVDATQTSSSVLAHREPSDVNCRPSTQSSSGYVTSLIETLQPPPPLRSPTHISGRSLIDVLHAQTSAALSISGARQSTLAGAVLGGVDLSLAAVVLGASNTSPSQSPAVTPASIARRQPEMRIHVTTESPERSAVTSARCGQPAGARPASGVGRRSAGVPHGSVRAFQQQQQQQHSGRQVGQHHNTLLVVPTSSSRSASSSPSMIVCTRGGSVSTSPSSASPSPSPEPVSRYSAAISDCRHSSDQSSATSRSLSTHRPLGVTRTPAAIDDHTKPSRSCVQWHCDQRQLTGGQATRTDELQEQETFV